MRGRDSRPAWLRELDEDDLEFVKRFLISSGSLKAMAREYEISYPTVRSRLDRLIAKVAAAENPRISDPLRRKVRVLLADGLLSPSVARQLLDAHRAAMKANRRSS